MQDLLDNLKAGTLLTITLTFQTKPNFDQLFQWRHYNLRIKDPGAFVLGKPVEVKCVIERVLQ